MATVTNSNVTPNDFIMQIQTEEDGSWHWADHISKLNSAQQTELAKGSPVHIHLGVKSHDGRYKFYDVNIIQRADGKLHYNGMVDKAKAEPFSTTELVQRLDSFLNSPTPTPPALFPDILNYTARLTEPTSCSQLSAVELLLKSYASYPYHYEKSALNELTKAVSDSQPPALYLPSKDS